jgi:hypothetical protein
VRDGGKPFFSILVPTRDRPETIRYCLESLKLQSFTNFEVVVCDNSVARPCRDVFDRVADARFRYVKPPAPLSMPDNWEYASQFAAGEYVGVLIDKTVLMPSALQAAAEAVRGARADLISWWNDNYVLTNEAAGYDVGAFYPAARPRGPEAFDPAEELRRRFSWDVRRGLEGRHYYWGKICFGVYHRDLIARIRARLGRLFLPLAPDYTSMLAALGLADSAVDLGRPFLISFYSALSHGAMTARTPAAARNYILSTVPAALDDLPLAGLYASQHNFVAYDYAQLQRRLGGRLHQLSMNLDNLTLRAKEDLDEPLLWADERERLSQEAILAARLRQLPLGARAGHRLAVIARQASEWRGSVQVLPAALRLSSRLVRPFPPLRRLGRRLLERLRPPAPHDPDAWEHREYFPSILEAARASDRYYASCVPHEAGLRSAGALPGRTA